jgi:hypothetical protein
VLECLGGKQRDCFLDARGVIALVLLWDNPVVWNTGSQSYLVARWSRSIPPTCSLCQPLLLANLRWSGFKHRHIRHALVAHVALDPVPTFAV